MPHHNRASGKVILMEAMTKRRGEAVGCEAHYGKFATSESVMYVKACGYKGMLYMETYTPGKSTSIATVYYHPRYNWGNAPLSVMAVTERRQ